MKNSFYSHEELQQIGFKSVGHDVLISRFARFYSEKDISIGNHVRIDDFSILSGNIVLGDYIHISGYCALYGKLGIEMENFTGLSPRCSIFSASDDFSGSFYIGPMVDEKLTNVTGGLVLIKQYSQIGASSVVMPNIIIGDGVAVGAMSLVLDDLQPWSIYAGIPAKFIKNRNKNLLKLDFNGN